MKKMKKILLLSDMHTFSLWGLMHPGFEAEDNRTGDILQWVMNTTQKKIWRHWLKLIDQIKKEGDPDIIIFNGDLCDGSQRRSGGRQTVSPNVKWQADCAIKLIEMLPDVPKYFTQGTEYHDLDEMPLEQYIAKAVGGEFGDDLVIDECGIRIHAQHFIPVSQSSWQYRCYSEDTEVLTERGWMNQMDMTDQDRIAVYDLAKKDMHFEFPLHRYVYDYTGKMIEFSNEMGSNILVTPNHKMLVQNYKGDYVFREAGELLHSRKWIDTLITAPFEDDQVGSLFCDLPNSATISLTSKEVDYSGKVVCFETSTGAYMTRRPGCYPTIQGNSTPVARDELLLAVNNSSEKYGRVDLAVRSHAHYFVSVMFRGQAGLITPAWQARTPYAVKKGIISPPDIGWVNVFVQSPECMMIDRRGITHITKPCRVVGRDKPR